jgi:hypothetical protein
VSTPAPTSSPSRLASSSSRPCLLSAPPYPLHDGYQPSPRDAQAGIHGADACACTDCLAGADARQVHIAAYPAATRTPRRAVQEHGYCTGPRAARATAAGRASAVCICVPRHRAVRAGSLPRAAAGLPTASPAGSPAAAAGTPGKAPRHALARQGADSRVFLQLAGRRVPRLG